MRNRALSFGLSFVFAAAMLGACATQQVRDDFNEADKAAADGGGAQGITPDSGQGLGVGAGGKTADVDGVTYAPNGTLALSGVLVYWTRSEPAPIPDGVYCDTCVQLPDNTSAISAADGSFSLTVPADADDVFLVVQKGQFRRVRKLTVGEDATKLGKELTTLPGKTNETKGDTIPKIALMTEPGSTTYDMIQTALEGLGIEDWDNLKEDHDKVKNNLSDYHMAMFPCGSGAPRDDEEKEAIRDFVAKGGKIYASDYSHAYADAVFPEYFVKPIHTTSQSAPDGMFVDDGLSSWLTAIGDDPNDAKFQGVWSYFEGVQAAEVPTPDGTSMASFEPKIWTRVANEANYGTGEASISFPYGCGRGMASIFHVHGTNSNDLLQQEKALLYMLLEVSACVKPGGDVN